MLKKTLLPLALAAVVALLASPAPAGQWEMLPDDVLAAVHLDMATLVKSELYRSLLAKYGDRMSNPGGKYLEFAEATDFDFRTDLYTLTIGAGGEPDDPEGPVYMIATGDFDREKIESWAEQSGEATVGKFENLRTFVAAVQVGNGPPPTAAFLDERTLILASTPDFPKLVRTMRGSGGTTKGSALGRLLAAAEGQFYVAVEIPEMSADGDGAGAGGSQGLGSLFSQLQSPAAGPMQSLQTIMLSVNARSGLDLALKAAADSPENGKLVYDMLNGYLMMGRSMSAQNPQLGEVLEHLQVEHSGTTVELTMSMSAEQIHAALEKSESAETEDSGSAVTPGG